MADSSDNDELQKQYQDLLNQYASALDQNPLPPPPPTPLAPEPTPPPLAPELPPQPVSEPIIPPPEIIPPSVSTPPSPLFFKILFYFSLLTFLAVVAAIIYSFSKSQPTTATPTPTPIPTETQLASVCELNEKTYQIGESFPAADGCNTCVCQPDQLIICTETACEATPSAIPTTTLVFPKVKLLNTSTWQTYVCGPISYKAPVDYSTKCNSDTDVLISKNNEFSTQANINIRYFDGNSRRQYWIKTIQATPSDVEKYMRFQETQFGSVVGLDVFASGGWWQGGYASPILISSSKTIVAVHGGRTFDDQTGNITRWDFSDTIASTIKFN